MVIKNLNNFIGQDKIKHHLSMLLKAFKNNKTSFSHVLLNGPSGYGKTTLAQIIGHNLGRKIWSINGNLLQKPADLISFFHKIKEFDVIFIDEIHAMNIKVIETLYSILNDNEINLILGKGFHSKIIKLKVPQFTLIGATTMLYKLTTPLINRFTTQWNFVNYTNQDMHDIVLNWITQKQQTAPILLTKYLASIGRHNPRTLTNILKQLDTLLASTDLTWSTLNYDTLINILQSIGIYEYGITEIDARYLTLFLEYNSALSLQTITTLLNYPPNFIVNYIEPFLINIGFLIKNHREEV